MARCPNCGRYVQVGVDFCPFCNEDITNVKSTYRNSSTSERKNVSPKSGKTRSGSYTRNTSHSDKSSEGSYNRVKRLTEENNRLKKRIGILTVSLVGVTVLFFIVLSGFITSAMNVSSLALKAKNSEEKLNNIMEEYNRLKGEESAKHTDSTDKNPFKADIEALTQTTTAENKNSELPVEVTQEIKTEPVTEIQETETQIQTQKETKSAEVSPEPVQSEDEPSDPIQTEDDPVQPEPDEDMGIESYAPIIPD